MSPTRVILIFSMVLAGFSTQAQKVVKVWGKVIDAETSAPVAGASIVFQGGAQGKGRSTDVEGRFVVEAQQGKTLTIVISNVGYKTKTVADVVAADTATVNVILERANAKLNDVVVRSSGSRRADAIASIYTAQKNSSSISDGISAEVIRRSPDRNTGEVLKRVSGASVQDNKFVVIRGLNERYNTSLLNNSILPSTEPDKKAFSFDIIPSTLVDNLVVFKTATPDLPGDFAGGAIKVATKDFPAKQLNELTINTSYNSLTTFQDFYKSRDKGDLDALGFFDNKSRLIPSPYYKRRGSSFFNSSDYFKKEVTKMFPNTFGYDRAGQSAPNLGISYTGGNTKLTGNNKFGYIYSLSYSEGRRVVERTRDDYFKTDNRLLYDYNTTSYDVRNNLSALLNLSYSFGKSKLSWKNLFNNDFTKTAAPRTGVNYVNEGSTFYYKSLNTEAMNNGLVNSVVEGLHGMNGGVTIDWALSYGFTYRNQPDQKVLTFVTNPNASASTYYFKPGYENSPEIRNAGRISSYLTEGIYGGNVNITKQFNWLGQPQKIKAGTYNYLRDRDVTVVALGYGTLNSTAPSIEITKDLGFENIISPTTIDQYNLTLIYIPAQSISYKGRVISNAGYLMLDNKFSEKLKLTWGARFERYKQTITTKSKEQNYDNNDVLPSGLLTYSLNKKTNLRLAAYQSVNRPELRELADYRVYDYENFITVAGNPNLKRAKITNVDLRYELFPTGGEIVSVSAFYKNFVNPIEQINQGNDVYSYANAKSASTYGAELEVRKKLDFIQSPLFRNLTAYANAAYIRGNVKFDNTSGETSSKILLQGQSPYLINAGLTYSTADDNFSVTALYNKIGPRLRFRGPLSAGGQYSNIFERPRDILDLQFTKRFMNKRLELKLTINDILAQSFKWYYKFEENTNSITYKQGVDRIINSYKMGTTTALSLKYNFNR